jgi:amino acid adenylation domain-containing protein
MQTILHEAFAARAIERKDAVAVNLAEKILTYRELNARSNQLAAHLRSLGVGPEVPVALYLDRSLEMVVAILGVLKAGGCYVPIDLAYPKERVAFMLEDTAAPVLLTQASLASSLPAHPATVLRIDSDWPEIAAESPSNRPSDAVGGNAAYIIYTSGSTGKPKGVVVTHHNVVRLLEQTSHWYGFNADDVWPLFHSYAFDVSVWELWGSLLYGGRLVIVPYLVSRSPSDFYQLLARERVTVLNQTPSAFRQLIWAESQAETRLALNLRYVICAGEALELQSLQPWFERHGDKRPVVVNMYGITETTVHSMYRPITREDLASGAGSVIGVPIPDLQIYLLDDQLKPVPPGVAGEIWVGGEGVARGYLKRDDLTSQRFLPIPFSSQPGARMYRSGDLGRRSERGEMEYLGRMDHQVKIRGFRVELGEIESALNRHPAIRESVVLAREEGVGDKRLAAYIVPAKTAPTVTELREYLGQIIPEYMMPARFIVLTALPLTTNGKVDRRALPVPDDARPALDRSFTPPRNEAESKLAGIWSEVLGVSKVGVLDNFFELGGDSIRSIAILSRAQEQGLRLSLQQMFEHPTVAGMAANAVSAEHAGQRQERRPFDLIPAQDRERLPEEVEDAYPVARLQLGMLPLSWSQEGLWFFEQASPGTAAYNIAEAWWLEGRLDVAALQRSLDEIVRRHETLRTAIGAKDGKPCQIVFPPKPFPLFCVDLRYHSSPEPEAQRLAEWDARGAFDLAQEPLTRVNLFRTADEKHLMAVNMHHLISDAWSAGVFLRELAVVYGALTTGQSLRLPDLPVQYGNFALWQRETCHSDRMRENLDYWTKQLQGAPPLLALPADRARPPVATHRGAALVFTWPESLAAGLKELARKEGATVFQILLAAFKILLQRCTLQNDIIVGSPFAGRDELETEDLIGFFVNTHALRTSLAGDPPFVQLLNRVREVTLSASLRQQPPLHHIVRALGTDRTLAAHSLFQVVFGWQRDFTEGWSLPGIAATRLDLDNGASKFDLTVLVTEASRQVRVRFEYSTDLFEAATVERWARQFRLLAESIVAEPWRRISEFALDTPEERRQWLARGEGLVTQYERESCVHEIFEAQAARSPAALALAWEDGEMSYGELNHRANLLAARLEEAGAGVDVVVGLCLERSMEMILGLLAILKTGAAYLPLDPANPRARNAIMLEDAQAGMVLTRESLRGAVSTKFEKILCIDEPDWPSNPEKAGSAAGRGPKATDIAYVMYTSGSTGRPKGVAVPHRAIARLVRNTDYIAFTAADVFLQLAPISFDASTFEIWGALLNGAKLVLHPPHMPSLEELGRVLQREKVTTLWLTSGWFNQMVDGQLASMQGLRFLLAGGESLSVPHVLKAARELRNCQLINGYGPTEGTTFTCCYRVPRNWPGRASVPIGRPIANTRVYILDASQNPAAEGAAGELYIGGDGVAHGYLNRPELTGAKFVTSPFAHERLYRTGDLARWLPDGNIEFIGRKDEQVKIRGFRVEPGEVEAALTSHQAVREAVVVARPDHSGTQQLAGYVVLHPDAAATNLQLREFLAVQLPSYMVPSYVVPLERMPLTSNGKVDRRALPAPENFHTGADGMTAAPRNATEVLLVEIWREILQRDQIGIHDNFFHLGGHSLLATQIVSRLARALGVELPVRVVFEAPTIEAMARVVDAAERPPAARTAVAAHLDKPSRAQKILDRLDELSDDEVEELLLESEEKDLQ